MSCTSCFIVMHFMERLGSVWYRALEGNAKKGWNSGKGARMISREIFKSKSIAPARYFIQSRTWFMSECNVSRVKRWRGRREWEKFRIFTRNWREENRRIWETNDKVIAIFSRIGVIVPIFCARTINYARRDCLPIDFHWLLAAFLPRECIIHINDFRVLWGQWKIIVDIFLLIFRWEIMYLCAMMKKRRKFFRLRFYNPSIYINELEIELVDLVLG